MATAKRELGAACPSGGNFYVCDAHPSRFVGCCAIDPCKTLSGRCSESDLRPMSFDEDKYDLIAPQECQAAFNALAASSDNDDVSKARRADDEHLWYACAAVEPPFMGCCKSNPCQADGCPKGHLGGAMVTNDTAKAWPFFGERDPSSTTTATATRTAASTKASSTAGPSPSSTGNDGDAPLALSAGATAGIAGGTAFAVLLTAVLLGWFCWRKHKRTKRASPAALRDSSQTQQPLMMTGATYPLTPTDTHRAASPHPSLSTFHSPPHSEGRIGHKCYSYYNQAGCQPQYAELHPALRSAPVSSSGLPSPPYWTGTQWVYPRLMPVSAPPDVQSVRAAEEGQEAGKKEEAEEARPVELPCGDDAGGSRRQSWGVGDDRRMTELAGFR